MMIDDGYGRNHDFLDVNVHKKSKFHLLKCRGYRHEYFYTFG